MYDMIIIGSGPAGLSAAVYAARAGLNFVVIEQSMASGGQILNTYEVDNYPGLPGVSGGDLAGKMRAHADGLGAEFIQARVEHIERKDESAAFALETSKGSYEAKTVVLAAGATHRKLMVPGEEGLTGMGVSYCATCDGAFFRGRTVAVIGGGDVAAEDAVFLARTCAKVYLIHRRDKLRAASILVDRVKKTDNIEILWNQTVEKISGEDMVESVMLRNAVTGEVSELAVEGVFVAVGILPNTKWLAGFVSLDENGYVVAGEDGRTNVPGIYAAGDIRTTPLRQIITAASDGACCVTAAQSDLAKR